MIKSPKNLEKEESERATSQLNFLQGISQQCVDNLDISSLTSVGGIVSVDIDRLLYLSVEAKYGSKSFKSEQDELSLAYKNFEESIPLLNKVLHTSCWRVKEDFFFDFCPPGRPLCIVQVMRGGNKKMLFYLIPLN